MQEDIVVPIMIFGSFAYAWRILLDYKTRKLLIEKGLVDDKVKVLFERTAEAQVPGALKWGMVLIAVGLAFFLGQMMPDAQEEYTVAFAALFGGIALVLYHTVAYRWLKNRSL